MQLHTNKENAISDLEEKLDNLAQIEEDIATNTPLAISRLGEKQLILLADDAYVNNKYVSYNDTVRKNPKFINNVHCCETWRSNLTKILFFLRVYSEEDEYLPDETLKNKAIKQERKKAIKSTMEQIRTGELSVNKYSLSSRFSIFQAFSYVTSSVFKFRNVVNMVLSEVSTITSTEVIIHERDLSNLVSVDDFITNHLGE